MYPIARPQAHTELGTVLEEKRAQSREESTTRASLTARWSRGETKTARTHGLVER